MPIKSINSRKFNYLLTFNSLSLLGSLLRQYSIPGISSIMLLEYEKPATLLIVTIVLIVLLSAILYRVVPQFQLLGESKNVL